MVHTSHNEYAPYASKLEQRIVFFFVMVGVISITYGVFFLIDFLPEKPTVDTTETASEVVEDTANDTEPVITNTQTSEAYPVSIIFDSLDEKEVTILNPESNSVEALDTALLSGAVRHPDSADFVNKGTIFLLGHSSYLPVVHNKNFQAFNGIQKLVWGDTIRLRSKDTEYVYSVERVYQAKATDADIAIEEGKEKLILATCNSFATKDDRFIVEAILVSSHAL